MWGIRVIEQDLLSVKSGVIGHQVNCQGVMGSGVAAAIRERFPNAYNRYVSRCASSTPDQLLGQCQVVWVGDGLYVANFFAQLGFGREKMQTDYRALASSVRAFNAFWSPAYRPELYVPYLMGCDRGGGDWDAYSTILDVGVNGPVTACRLPQAQTLEQGLAAAWAAA